MGSTALLHDVLAKLRAHADLLRGRGLMHVSVFGSVARGDAGPDSDVDLLIDVTPEVADDLLAYAGVAADLEDIVGRRVDVALRRRLRAHVRPSADAQAVRAF